MKRVCLVIHSLGIGGMERVMQQLAVNFVKRRGIDVHLILIGRKREIVYHLPDSINLHKPDFYFNNSRRTIGTLKTMFFLRREVRRIDPDTILSFGEFWNNLVLLSLVGLSYPIYISDRSQPDKDLGKVQNLLRDILYPSAAGYIAQTNEAKKICLTKGWNRNVKVIGNPIRCIESGNAHDKENIVLSVGRLIRTKNFDHLIRMFVEIGNPDWKLLIVGGDAKKLNLSGRLNTLIHELNAENHVFLEGEQKDIEEYYKKSKIFAFTSSSEGFPNVIGEALSAGLPVISYDCIAGPSDMIIDGENGYLIPVSENEKFKNKLRVLMENKGIRNKLKQNSDIKIKHLNIHDIADQFLSFMVS